MVATAIRAEATLADLAASWTGASRVFQRHELDYCCHGKRTLADACRDRRLPLDNVLVELRAEATPVAPEVDWAELPSVHLIAHILDHFHASHRSEVPRLLAMAAKVEHVHAHHPQCPHGLAAHLHAVGTSLEQHMQKEERVLFPLLIAGGERSAWAPIQCMLAEHDNHGRDLAQLRQLAHGYVPPADACPTWRALYLGLSDLERAVMEHVHLENHVLFARAMHG